MKRILPLLFLVGVTSTPALAESAHDEVALADPGIPLERVYVAQADTPAAVTVEPFAPQPTETALAPDATAAPATEQTAPADALHDPLTNPAGAYDDIRAAKRTGWGAVFLVVLIMACGVASRISASLSWLAKPRVLLAVGSLGTFGATAYNAIALGGTWVAALAAAVPPLIAVMIKVWQWEPESKQGAV